MKKNILLTKEMITIISLYLQISNSNNRKLVHQYLYNLEQRQREQSLEQSFIRNDEQHYN